MNRQIQNKAIIRLRRKILFFLFLKNCVIGLTVFFFFYGVIVLALRCCGFDGFEKLPVFISLISADLIVIPFAFFFSLRKLPGVQQTAAILDWKNSAGGILMASFETDAGVWTENLEEKHTIKNIPYVFWQPKQALFFLFAAVVFAVSSVFVPVSALSVAGNNRLNIDNEIKRLTSQLDVMEEENLLDVEEIKTRKNELEKIQEHSEGEGPVKTFDALDHIAERLNQKAAEALEEAQRTTETLAKNETIINEVQEVSSGLDDNEKKSLTEGLARSLEKMLSENKSLADDLKKTLEEQTKQEDEKSSGRKPADTESLKKKLQENDLKDMTQEEFKQLCETMKQCRNDAQRMCENLQNAGFPVNKEALEKMRKSQNIEKKEAERMLSDLWADCDECNGKNGGEKNKDRQTPRVSPRFNKKQDWATDPDALPDDTKFEKNEDTEGAEFKAQFLPPADLEAFLNSKKIGASTSAPEDNGGKVSTEHGGAIKSVSEVEGSSRKQTVYPQHRGAVSRFFEK